MNIEARPSSESRCGIYSRAWLVGERRVDAGGVMVGGVGAGVELVIAMSAAPDIHDRGTV